MTWRDGLGLAWKGIAAHKMRSLLTMLGIVMGVVAVIVLVAIGQGIATVVTARIEALGSNVVLVTPAAGTPFPLAQASLAQGRMTFAHVIPEMSGSAVLSQDGVQAAGQVVATSAGYFGMGGTVLQQGSFFTAQEVRLGVPVCVLNTVAAADLFAGKNPVGSALQVGTQTYRVAGVADLSAAGAAAGSSPTVIVPVSAAAEIFPRGQLSELLVQAPSARLAVLSARYLVNFYTQQFHEADAVQVSSDAALLQTVHATHGTFTKLLLAMTAMALLVGGAGIMNVMLVSVRERTREIGLRMAMGASREDILLQFLLEAMGLSLGGGIVGIAAGLGMIRLLPLVLHIPAQYSAAAAVWAFVFSIAAGLIFGLYPAIRASGLEPIASIRYDG